MATSETTAQNGRVAARADIDRDLLARHQTTGRLFWRAVALFGVLFVLGIIGFVMRLSDGVSDTAVWGYYAAVFAFILTTAQAAPIVAIATRLTKGHWRRPISRAAELWTLVGLFNLLLFIPLLWVLPSLEDQRRTLWFFSTDPASEFAGVPVYSPHIWATAALVFLVITGLALLWVSALPDLASMRDNSTGWRQRWGRRLAPNWHGTSAQWNMLYHRTGTLGALYFMMLVFVHFLISVDFLMTLVPGWIDALFPVTHAANALQAGVATMLLTMFFLRQFGGYKDYITLDQMWALGKLLFALSLLWFWFWFSSFNVLWYGNKPNERAVLELLIKGPYQPIFMAAFILNFVVPLFTMMWNPLRKSLWGPPLIATSVLIGTLLDRIRLYVAGYSIPGIGDSSVDKHQLSADLIPASSMPDVADIFIIVGAISGSILVYLLGTRLFPVINIWEQKELLLYKVHKRFHRTEVMVLGRPD
ncbi:MAG: polysulfide reductase NrfD [Chloroflexi bacterium]|nr:polysulfide reductase NrfD [Chloroflexota bacterium]